MSPTAKANMDEAPDDCAHVYIVPLQETWCRDVNGTHEDAQGRRWRDTSMAHRANVVALRGNATCN